MLESPTFRSTGLPIILTLIAIVLFNFGLYIQLGSQPRVDRFALPYNEDFSNLSENPFEEFGGDWEIRDEMLVQLDTTGFDLMSFVPLTIPDDTSYQFAATLRYFGGSMGGGLLFNAQQVTSRQKSHMVRFNVDNNQLWLIYGYFGDDSDFVGQGSVQIDMPIDDISPQQLSIRVDSDTYTILHNDRQLALNIPLQYRGGATGFISAASQTGFDDIVIAPLDNTPYDFAKVTVEPDQEVIQNTQEIASNMSVEIDEPIVYAESFDATGTDPFPWVPISGNWVYENNALIQTQTELFDLHTVYQNTLTYPMTYLATFRHLENVGGGLLFNMASPTSTENAYMVRYISDADVLAWGYFDESDAFVGVGSVPVSPPSDTQHTLGVSISDNAFNIILDGDIVAYNVPLHQVVSTSHVGLTASQSSVAFDSVRIYGTTTVTDNTQASTTTANIDSEAASGNWMVDNNVIRQTDTEATDFIAGTGLAGEQFTIKVDIQFETALDDAGAGIVFHMSERNNPASGYLVRFANHGRTIFWGQFDKDRVFSGLGDVTLSDAAIDSATLKIIVRQTNFDILVNDQVVAEDISLERRAGWIGLVSFRGAVSFTNLDILVGEQ